MVETPPKKKLPRLWEPAALSAFSILTADEKRALPPPEILGPVILKKEAWSVEIRDSHGREWRLSSRSAAMLRWKLMYFKTLDRDVIHALFEALPRKLQPGGIIRNWPFHPELRCVTCHAIARRRQQWGESEQLGCATCDVSDQEVAEGAALFEPIPTTTGKAVKDSKPKPAIKRAFVEVTAPKPSLSLAERLALRKKLA